MFIQVAMVVPKGNVWKDANEANVFEYIDGLYLMETFIQLDRDGTIVGCKTVHEDGLLLGGQVDLM